VIESLTTKAEQILEQSVTPGDREKVFARGRSRERSDLLRQVIELLILNGIPTRIICDLLKLEPNSVQYHLRWLEANGKIMRPSKTANCETARATNE